VERRLQRLIARIARDCEVNRDVILRFLGFLEGQGYSAECRRGYAQTLYSFDRWIGGKSFKDVSEDEILGFLKGLKPVSRATYASRIKAFYRWLFHGSWRRGPYPEIVQNIEASIKKRDYPFKSLSDLLIEEEVVKLIEAASSERDKCLMAMLYDTAARPHEILKLRIGDLRLNEVYGEIVVSGKTGFRRLPLTFSLPYLRRWLNDHPEKDNPEAPLFPKRKLGRGGDRLTVMAVDALLKKLAQKAGIKKKVTAYILRHSRLTKLASVLREQQLKAFAGWTAGSKMPEIYVRLSGIDLDAAILEHHGITVKRKETILKVKQCGCGHVNPPTAVFCEACHAPLDKAVIRQTFELEERVRRELEALKKMVSENITVLMQAVIGRSPEEAKLLLKSNPELLRRFIEAREGEFIQEYARHKGLSSEKILDDFVREVLTSEEKLEKLIKSIILRDAE